MAFTDPHAHPGVLRQLAADSIDDRVWPVVPDEGARSALAVTEDGLVLYTPSSTHRWSWAEIASVSCYRFQVVVGREGHPDERLATLGQHSRQIATAVTAAGGIEVGGSAVTAGTASPDPREEDLRIAAGGSARTRSRTDAVRERAEAQVAASATTAAWWCLAGGAATYLLGLVVLLAAGNSIGGGIDGGIDGDSGSAGDVVLAVLFMSAGGAAVVVALIAFGVMLGVRMARN